MRTFALLLFLLLGIAVTLTGCGSAREFRSVPMERMGDARILGGENVRTWGDVVSEPFMESLADSIRQEDAWYSAHPEEKQPETVDLLAISGGGDDGAYGAGLLCGWTDRGDRPLFKLVTGISTGALIAPFAFLGPDYDHVLREGYTGITIEDVAEFRGILAMLFTDGLYDTDPLAATLLKWLSDEAIDAVGDEHRKGRRLFIATVNLEAQRPVIWDMGAIACSDHPGRHALFRKVMLASASIPGAFEPQYFEVELDGERYEELHVDGGTATQVFLWGGGVNVQSIGERAGISMPRRAIRLFVLRNGRFYPEHDKMDGLFVDITGRAVATLIKTQGVGDLIRLYFVAEENGMEFNLTSITPEFTLKTKELFQPEYMGQLFDFGHKQITTRAAWRKTPPYIALGGTAAKP